MIWVGEEAVLGCLAMAVPVADCPSTQVSWIKVTYRADAFIQVIGSNDQSLQLSSRLAKKLSKQVIWSDFAAPDYIVDFCRCWSASTWRMILCSPQWWLADWWRRSRRNQNIFDALNEEKRAQLPIRAASVHCSERPSKKVKMGEVWYRALDNGQWTLSSVMVAGDCETASG